MPKRKKTKVAGPGQARSSGGRPRKQPTEQPTERPSAEFTYSTGEDVDNGNVLLQLAEVSLAAAAEPARAREQGHQTTEDSEGSAELESEPESEPIAPEPDACCPCGLDHGPPWFQRPVYTQKIRRVKGSVEAQQAVFHVVAFETWALKKEGLALQDYELANKQSVEADYAHAMRALADAFPSIVCCDAFVSGQCTHGRRCECGWLLAPWPWIPHRLNSPFCDCHLEMREDWLARGSYDGCRNGLELWPKAGPRRGDGSGGSARICMGCAEPTEL